MQSCLAGIGVVVVVVVVVSIEPIVDSVVESHQLPREVNNLEPKTNRPTNCGAYWQLPLA